MASAAARLPYVSLETYLRAADLEPDMDYVDGVLEERNLGDYEHASLQGAIYAWFHQHRKQWGISVYPELRVQVAPTRYRVPDVCVLPSDWDRTPVVVQTPLLCIEVLSPEDTLSRQRRRAEDYLRMGVPQVWIFDPASRLAFVLNADGVREYGEGTLSLPGSEIALPLAPIFSALDE